MTDADIDEEGLRHRYKHKPIYYPFTTTPKLVDHNSPRSILATLPLTPSLLVNNEASEIRDFCANERTFLSYLRLSVYLAIVATAIIISFHLKNEPTALEKRASLPLGIVFWAMAVLCLGNGVGRYLAVVDGYARRRAVVQTGWKTQAIMTALAVVIIVSCVFFLGVNADDKT